MSGLIDLQADIAFYSDEIIIRPSLRYDTRFNERMWIITKKIDLGPCEAFLNKARKEIYFLPFLITSTSTLIMWIDVRPSCKTLKRMWNRWKNVLWNRL